ncbi:pleiotropic regulatory protein RsmS [Vibrio ostreicida]|uniref:Pleiotropic regulatory protein RsmS n=1 Tax=Vibrio ostreicida TaxID=526588 RepID=A0ABT8BRF0_9VIBR|nr:pleiotropic regulatory protein RsmS [Vibrio ostreicida]MDN3609660.1 pleiotropic regulatory protein RsmS [Vibrio ostreicida]NPD09508.1 pleiotropic regulatory protein RsmS [Vibrio ostreicida]
MSSPSSELDQAPDEIKLAVDLIYLIESNNIDPNVALAAINIVKSDLEKKLEQTL